MSFQDTERTQLDRNYRIAKRAELLELYADPLHGTCLRKLVATLGHFGQADADRMTSYVADQAKKWLAAAPYEIRCAALSAINSRIQAIRVRAGMPVFDDPLPRQDDDVFILAKKALQL